MSVFKYQDDRHKQFAEEVTASRIALGIRLYEAAKYFGISVVDYCRFENGTDPGPDFQLGEEDVEVVCHQCQKPFMRKPIINIPFPAYICPDCVKEQ